MNMWHGFDKHLYTFIFSNGNVYSVEALTVQETMEIFKEKWHKNFFQVFNFEVLHNTDYIIDNEEGALYTFVFSNGTVFSCKAVSVEVAMKKIDIEFNQDRCNFYSKDHFKIYRNLKYSTYVGVPM